MAPPDSSPHESSPLLDNSHSMSSLPLGAATEQRTKGRISLFSSRVNEMVKFHTGSIGMLGSMSIAVNSLTGPAMLNLPATYERSGIIPTTACIIFVCILSSFCSLHTANVISKVPNNHDFKREVEFSEVFREFWGMKWFYATQCMFYCCITCLNISSIVDTSQVVDTFLGHWSPHGTVALQFLSNTTHIIQWDYSICTDLIMANGNCVPFKQSDGILVTAGTVVTTIVFLPLALMDLKENASWQILGFFILLISSLQFIIQFCMSGLQTWHVSLWGHDWDDLFGVVLFNFALVVAIPAWLYEREPHVDVPTVIYSSSVLSLILYIAVGILGHMAIPHVSQNMLESMMSGAFGTVMQLGASIFAFAIVGLGIPLFSVLTRLNLTGSGLCSQSSANVLAVYLPFAVSFLLYDGKSVVKLLSWGGTIFTSLVAFILPIMLALHVVEEYGYPGYISVYLGYWERRKEQTLSLRVLLFLTVAAVCAAIIGNIF